MNQEEKELCCGCGACVQVCPTYALSMKMDDKGFWYPKLNAIKCINCSKCSLVCDFKKRNQGDNTENNVVNAYSYMSSEMEVLKNSTSGGAFTAISNYVLKNNGIVIGVVEDKDLKIKHVITDNYEERDKMRGSKYVQSYVADLFDEIKKNIDQERMVLFTGTPCQIAALYSYLGNRYRDSEFLFTCDNICHGVTSPLLLQEFHGYIETKMRKKLKKHIFRYKPAGWDHIECLIYEDGQIDYKSAYSQLYKYIFDRNLGHRSSCFNCKYTSLNRQGDITLGDFWGISENATDIEKQNGVSLILVNSKKGKSIIQRASLEGKLKEVNIESACKRQPHLSCPPKKADDYDDFWKFVISDDFKAAVVKYVYNPDFAEFKRKIKCFIMLLRNGGRNQKS